MRRGDLVTVVYGDFGKLRRALVIQSDYLSETANVTVLLLSRTMVEAPLIRLTVPYSPKWIDEAVPDYGRQIHDRFT